MKIDFTNFYHSINNTYKPYLLTDYPIEIYYGGSSSGKSFFVESKILFKIMNFPGHNVMFLRKVDKSNNTSTFPLMKQLIYNFTNWKQIFNINHSTKDITYLPNGNKMIFKGLNDPESLKSLIFETGPLTIIHIEEANQITKDDFNLMETRLRGVSRQKKQIILTFNPVSVYSWLKEYFFDNDFYGDQCLKVKSTYQENDYLTQEDKDLIERLKFTNPSYYNIYGLGNWGQLEGLVFNKFTVEDFPLKLVEDEYRGMDFGMRHPTVIAKCFIKNRTLYIYDEFYRSELATNEIITEVEKTKFINKADFVLADNSRPDTIREWNNNGYNVHETKKGPGSVKAGLDFMRGFDIIIHKSNCPNIASEFSSYVWKQTKDGKVLDEPVKMNDDGIDSVRYALEPLWSTYGSVSDIPAGSLGL